MFSSCIYIQIHVYLAEYGYVYIYAAFRHLKIMQNLFTMHSNPGNWCVLNKADATIVQRHSISMQRALVPAQQPRYMVVQLSRFPYK